MNKKKRYNRVTQGQTKFIGKLYKIVIFLARLIKNKREEAQSKSR